MIALTDDAKAVLHVLRGGGSLKGDRTVPQPHRFSRSAKKDPSHRVPVSARAVSDLVEAGLLSARPKGRGAGTAKFDVIEYVLSEKGRTATIE